jgi:hypothetical protein
LRAVSGGAAEFFAEISVGKKMLIRGNSGVQRADPETGDA